MIELACAVISLVVGFIAGWKYREYLAIKNINAVMEAAMGHSEKATMIQIKVEKVDDQIFVYNKATSEYMAHAANRELLEKMLKEKFPGKSFGASTEDMKKLDESI